MKIRISLLTAVILPLVACAQSASPPSATAPHAAPVAAKAAPSGGDPRATLAARIPGTKPEDLRATPVPGVFELTHGTDISYVSEDAKYVFSGDLYRVSASGAFPNLSEVRRREMRLGMVGAIPDSQMVVFGPAKAAHTITVFTDVDCPWCQRMHSQIAAYNKLGIRVRYLFYPRSGPDTESWYKADAVWCSADRNTALTDAKRGEPLPKKACPDSPVARDFQLGREIGVRGTPAVVLETGELIPGYLAPPQMLAHINKSIAEAATPRANE